jgi:hypothetical protein
MNKLMKVWRESALKILQRVRFAYNLGLTHWQV